MIAELNAVQGAKLLLSSAAAEAFLPMGMLLLALNCACHHVVQEELEQKRAHLLEGIPILSASPSVSSALTAMLRPYSVGLLPRQEHGDTRLSASLPGISAHHHIPRGDRGHTLGAMLVLRIAARATWQVVHFRACVYFKRPPVPNGEAFTVKH